MTQNYQELLQRTSQATKQSLSERERLLNKLSKEADEQVKKLAPLVKAYEKESSKLESILYNIEHIDEYINSKKKNKE